MAGVSDAVAAPDPARSATAPASALYVGRITHRRFSPREHSLGYRAYALLLDLDELPHLSRRLRLFSLDRFNLFSLQARDHGSRPGIADGGTLRESVESRLRAAGLPTGGPIRLLTMPRLLGYVFNPLSLYFCHAPDGTLRAIVYEVTNTFGERHSYLLPVAQSQRQGAWVTQRCAKQFHVSPFLGLDLQYRFDVQPPDAARPRLHVGITTLGGDGPVLNATMVMERRPLDDRALARVFFGHPLLTLKVTTAIHWEALKLWLKRVPLHAKPAAPASPCTVQHTGAASIDRRREGS